MNEKPKKIKLKLFAMAKDEAAYIPEWVFHHLYFGFDEIEIWLNNITDNSEEVCTKISLQEPRFKYKNVDHLLQEVQEANLPFQHILYNAIFQEELTRNDITHLFFLDLDEFWISKNFKTNIKEILKKFTSSDTLSFSWYIDDANYGRLPFEKRFTNKQIIYKNKHVKSLVKLSSRVQTSHAHNSIVKEGIAHHSNGFLLENNEENFYGAFLSIKDFEDTQASLDDYFIFHAIYKSQIEYIANLLKGLKQDGSKDILKTNREGFKKGFENVGVAVPVQFNINDSLLLTYYTEYQKFIDKLDLWSSLQSAHSNLLKQYMTVKEYVNNNRLINEKYSNLFFGINLEGFQNSNIRYSIDNIETMEGVTRITGWIASLNPNIKIELYSEEHGDKKILVGDLDRVARLDVLVAIDEKLPIHCGFIFSFENSRKIRQISLLEIYQNKNIQFLVEFEE